MWEYIFGGATVFALIVGVFSVYNGRTTRRYVAEVIRGESGRTQRVLDRLSELEVRSQKLLEKLSEQSDRTQRLLEKLSEQLERSQALLERHEDSMERLSEQHAAIIKALER